MIQSPATEYWRTRYVTGGGADWTNHYWTNHRARHRLELVGVLRRLAAFSSVLELGCNAGPNLRLVRECFPSARVTGVDVSNEAISKAQAGFGGDKFVSLYVQDLRDYLDEKVPDLSAEPVERFDVVFTCYVLSYLDPEELPHVLAQLLKLARTAVVLAEPMAMPGVPGEKLADIPEYRHTYIETLERFLGVTWKQLRVWPLSKVDHLEHALVITI